MDTSKKLLLVEDEAIIALNLKKLCQMKGYDVIGVVSSGEEALKIISEQQTDILLIDIILNGELDGIDTVNLVRKNYDIPYVYLTAHSDEKTLKRAQNTNPYGYILKPINHNDLYFTLKLALHKHEIDKKLKASEELHRITLSNISDAVLITDKIGNFTYICPNVDNIFGYSDEELKSFKSIYSVIDQSLINYQDLDKKGTINNIETHITNKNGNEHIVLINIKIVAIGNGTILFTIRDISERKKLLEQNKFQAELLNQIQDYITATDLIGTITYVNDIESKRFGIPKEKMIGMSVKDYGDDITKGASQEEIINATLETGSWRGLVVNKTLQGEEVFLDARVWLTKNDSGQPTGMLGISTDITKLKIAESQMIEQNIILHKTITEKEKLNIQLQESLVKLEKTNQEYAKTLQDLNKRDFQLQSQKEFYELILESVQDGIWVTDKNDFIIYTNSAMEKIAGVAKDKIIGNNLINDFSEETIGIFKKFYFAVKQELVTHEYMAPVTTPAGRKTCQKGWLIPIIKDKKFDGIICTIQELKDER